MSLLKNVRALILIALAFISSAALLVPILLTSNKIIVSSMSPNADCSGIGLGSEINQLSGRNIRSISDFNSALAGVKKGDFVSLLADLKPANCAALADGDFGFTVSASKKVAGFELGGDIAGGTIYNYKPDEGITTAHFNELASSIGQRVKVFGFEGVDVSADSANNFIKVASSNPDANVVFYPGIFEARLEESIPVHGGSGDIPIGSNKYAFTVSNKTLSISIANQKQIVPVGGKFSLEGIDFYFQNATDTSAIIAAEVFNNSGVIQTYPQSSSISLNQNNQQYMFVLPVAVSVNVSDNFQKITANAPTTLVNGQISIDGTLDYSLDGRLLSRLVVPLDFARQPLANKQVSIIGFSQLQSDVANDRIKVLAALESGVIDTSLSLESQQAVPATKLDIAFVTLGVAAAVMLLFTIAFSAARYNNLKGGSLAFLFIIAEVLSVLGFIYAEVSITGINFVINFFAVAGLSIAAVLASLHYLIIAEQSHSGRESAIRFGYRKILGVNALIYLSSVVVAILLASYLDPAFGVIVFLAVIIDWLLAKPLFEGFARKTF